MCRLQCVLALVALYVGLAHSWDIAVSEGDQLVFYTDDGTVKSTVNFISHNLTALAYDEVHNMMLYVDKQSNNDSICGYNLLSMENKCFIKRYGSNIHSIAFDPATDTLFFTDTDERTINWISLKPGSNNNVFGNVLIEMDDGAPTDIAVDSCRGSIYWANPGTEKEKNLESAQLDGSERRKVTHSSLLIYSLAMDPQTQKIYYFDGCELCSHEFLNRATLDGEDYFRFLLARHLSAPQELTVSKDYLYWMNGTESNRTVWRLPKNATGDEEPNAIIKFYDKIPLSIAANYKIKEQILGLQDCQALSRLIPTITVTNNSTDNAESVKEYR